MKDEGAGRRGEPFALPSSLLFVNRAAASL
ncbi:MAG: hypothetical protein QOG15_349 [Solirubrobacteraceae bacterium]|jgi:hypothetical protein|nr:hypothetical protein [Solirubrobacteraceae bacterium]